jgi:hypothetical protein
MQGSHDPELDPLKSGQELKVSGLFFTFPIFPLRCGGQGCGPQQQDPVHGE